MPHFRDDHVHSVGHLHPVYPKKNFTEHKPELCLGMLN
jgi:hypothetical protein